jgi:hypothetical protein
MDKDSEKSNAPLQNEIKIPATLKDAKAFKLLRSEYRKKLYKNLNSVLVPQIKETTLKCMYLYPEKKIKKSAISFLTTIMEETLMLHLQEQLYYDENCISEAKQIINNYKNGKES